MIKASELRIETLISYIGEVIPIFSIERGGHTFWAINNIRINKGTGYSVNGGEDVFTAMPLTEDWLIRLGYFHVYTTGEGDQLWQCGELELLISKGNIHVSHGTEYVIGRPLQFVHQLQNAHHALTGEELQIKQP